MNNGWIKTYRKTLDNPVVCKDADHLAVWMYLLWEATHAEIDMYFKGKRITLQPGQLITGRKKIAEKFNISQTKVQRILKRFECEHQIEQQTSSQNRLITVLNWHEYQNSEQQSEQRVNNNRTTSEQRVNTNKNVRMKECKNNIKDTKVSMSNETSHSTQKDDIDYKSLIEFFNKKTNGVFGNVRYPINNSRKGMIRARIRQHGKEAFAEMIDNAVNSNFLKGDNNTGWRAKFDWMIRPGNFQKIIEGNYNNKQTFNDSLLTHEQVSIMIHKGEISSFDKVSKIQTAEGKIYYKRR